MPAGTIFTCPMHPEVRQEGPGSCPICGMALEPEMPTADTGPNPELADMTRRFWIGARADAAGRGAGDGRPPVRLASAFADRMSNWVQLVFATPVVLWAGWPFFVRGAQSLVTRNLNMFTLIALGTGVAWVYSVVATLAPGVFPPAFRGHDGAVAVYFEAAAVITVLVLLGQVLELRAREQTSGAIRALLDLAPKTAHRVTEHGDEVVALDAVAVGDRLRVRPGEKVPVDGELIEGHSTLDESMVTGESMPVSKDAGAKVIGGTINRSGGFVMRAEKVGRDTMLARIVQMVATAQRSRAPIQRLADQVAAWFVPAVIAVAVLAFAAWATFGPEPRFAYGLVAAVTVLIIACPCALGLATPMSIMVGVGRGAQAGVLIKNAEALERMEKVDTLVVDKTGTLTEGKPKVVARHRRGRLRRNRHAAARRQRRAMRASIRSARAIVEAAAERKIELATGARLRFANRQGRDRHGRAPPRRARQRAVSGRAQHRDATAAKRGRATARSEGATAIFVAIDGKLAGVIAIADPVKETAAQALERAQGRRHRHRHADRRQPHHREAVARKLGITEVEAEVLPEQKSAVVEKLQARGPRRRDGRRRRQRRAGAGRRRCRHRHGHRHRRRDGKRRRHAAERRSRAASCGRGGCRARRCATSGRICSSPSSTTPPACRSRPACSIRCSAFCCRR